MNEKKRILYHYIELLGYSISDLLPRDYARYYKRINELLERGTVDEVIAGIDWMSKQDYQWTLETLDKKWLEFKKDYASAKRLKQMEDLLNENRI